jgi:hypothetical protein
MRRLFAVRVRNRDSRITATQNSTPRALDPRAMAFVRGLAFGALFGAALAGSRMWRRGRTGERAGRAEPDDPTKAR